jgi:hypothetical protein
MSLGYRSRRTNARRSPAITLAGGSSGNRMLIVGDSIAAQHAYVLPVTSLTRDGSTTMTVNWTSHGLIVGSQVYGFRATDEALNGHFEVATVVNANSFTVTLPVASGGAVTAKAGGFIASKQDVLTDIGSINWLSSLNGACFDIVGVVAEGASLTSYLPTLIANANDDGLKYDWVTIISGINDAAADVTGATIAANIIAATASLRSAGKKVIISTVGPWSSGHGSYTAGRYTEVQNANTLLRSYAAGRSGVYIMDSFEATTGTAPLHTNVLSDGLHPSQLGCYTYAKRFMADYPTALPAGTTLLAQNAADDVVVTPANRQFWPTPMFTGSAGLGVTYFGTANTTGTIPTDQWVRGYSPNTGGATTTLASSLVAASTGNGNAIKVDIAASEDGDWAIVHCIDNFAEFTAGEYVRLVMRVRAEATGGGAPTNLARVNAFLQLDDAIGSKSSVLAALYNASPPAAASYPQVTEQLTLMTPKLRIASMTGVTLTQPWLITTMRAACTNTFYVENPALRATTE